MHRLLAIPMFLVISGLVSVSMFVPASVALYGRQFHDARSFFYSGVVGLVLTAFIAIAMAGQDHNRRTSRQLIGLMGVFAGLPLLLAVPFYEAVQGTTFLNAYIEMVSSLTTTGATLFDAARLSDAEHLWRAQVAWMGGLLMWIAAAAVLAPLSLGGFEVTSTGEPGQIMVAGTAQSELVDPARRIQRVSHALIPIYCGLTLAAWVLLLVAGDTPLVALSHAMSVISTSGISPVGGLSGGQSGMAGELILFAFMVFALSRQTFSGDSSHLARIRLDQDPEFRMGVALVAGVTGFLFLRHWVASFEVGEEQNFLLGLKALWGGIFTVMSFLTTTGFESADWSAARAWSGLGTPGVLLMGLAVIGGGVATTAGGVKLLRMFALFLVGRREMEKMIHPNSVARQTHATRTFRREGAFIAWVFFMLFAVTLSMLTVLFGVMHVAFDQSLLLAVASLSNTGPLLAAVPDIGVSLASLGSGPKLLFAAAMILGRLELLAIIVVISPELWRN